MSMQTAVSCRVKTYRACGIGRMHEETSPINFVERSLHSRVCHKLLVRSPKDY